MGVFFSRQTSFQSIELSLCRFLPHGQIAPENRSWVHGHPCSYNPATTLGSPANSGFPGSDSVGIGLTLLFGKGEYEDTAASEAATCRFKTISC